VRLGAQLLTKTFIDQKEPPTVVSIPGAVTATVRRSWDLLGCLSLAAPQILDDAGACKTKTDIRDITHLHHALDACVLAYTSLLLPRDGGLWQLMIKRNPNEAERAALVATGCFDFDQEGRFGLRDLPPDWKNQLRARLAEKRVVQHVPADMGGLRVEENTRGIEKIEDGRAYLHQRSRDAKTGQIKIESSHKPIDKVVGLSPANGIGKLRPLKGVRVITDNFGIALLDHAAEGEEKTAIIPWHKVWHRLGILTERNSGYPPKILRKGMLIRVPNKNGRSDYRGIWMVRGVQSNQKQGLLIDMSYPSVVEYRQAGRSDCKQNVKFETLIGDGLQILKSSLTGVTFTAQTSNTE
jgi:hypothetical protein